ncbi:hypothetical protein AB0L65_35475 [Nonomuraea sp. NPDC052116]
MTPPTAWIDENAPVLTGLADRIWAYAEPSLREWRARSGRRPFPPNS